MPNTAKVELNAARGEPELKVQVPRGTSLEDMLRIQEKLFVKPPPELEHIVLGRCKPCLSGIRVTFEEYVVNPSPIRDLELMVTNLNREVRDLSRRLETIGAAKIGGAVAEMEF